MNSKLKQYFDFSLDDEAFKEQLAARLQTVCSESIEPLEDEDLEFINAAGTGLPPILQKDDLL